MYRVRRFWFSFVFKAAVQSDHRLRWCMPAVSFWTLGRLCRWNVEASHSRSIEVPFSALPCTLALVCKRSTSRVQYPRHDSPECSNPEKSVATRLSVWSPCSFVLTILELGVRYELAPSCWKMNSLLSVKLWQSSISSINNDVTMMLC